MSSKGPHKHKHKGKSLTRQQRKSLQDNDNRERVELSKRVVDEAPKPGFNPLFNINPNNNNTNNNINNSDQVASQSKNNSGNNADNKSENKSNTGRLYSGIRKFSELPISKRTLDALNEGGFTRLTDIQRAALPHALAGRDILGAARTGSGKTLAFLIPVIECLYRNSWSALDGLGAIILSPTRELSMQIFDVLRVIGKNHSFSAGLIIGGKTFAEEQERIMNMNILICTPGRLLQHMDETYGFDCNNLQILVLDEADRMLDSGFQSTLNSIISNIPNNTQTLLFSATQTKNIKDLARLSLKSPEYLSVHELDSTNLTTNSTNNNTANTTTPNKLQQHYMLIEPHQKFDLLFSFIKTHLKTKSIVFLSSCKQVRYCYEIFRRLRPGIPLLHLHGRMNQTKRMGIYYEFCNKSQVLLFATDIAARGLDFPNVDWIVQFDCPDSIETYIHRVGRTARYRNNGKALLFLTEPESQEMLNIIKQKKIDIKRVRVDATKMRTVSNTFSNYLIQDNDLKYLAQKAFIAYIRSVYLQSNKAVFNINNIDLPALSQSFGLNTMPKFKFSGNNTDNNKLKNMPYKLKELLTQNDSDNDNNNNVDNSKGMNHVDKLLARKNNTVYSEARLKLMNDDNDDLNNNSDNDILTIKRKDQQLNISDDEQSSNSDPDNADASKSKKTNKKISVPLISAVNMDTDRNEAIKSLKKSATFVSETANRLEIEDRTVDKIRDRQRIHEKHVERRRKEKNYNIRIHGNNNNGEEEEEEGVQLALSGEELSQSDHNANDSSDNDNDDNDNIDNNDDGGGDMDNSNSDSNNSSSSNLSDTHDNTKQSKRKLQNDSVTSNKKNKMNSKSAKTSDTSKLTLKQQEEMALKLLGL